MGNRTVFLRSPLGARVRSPLGAFKCRATRFLEIFTSPPFVLESETYIVTGELFGATQWGGSLSVCNTPDADDVVVAQSIVSWGDTSITFTFSDPSDDLPADSPVWIVVESDAGESDSAVTVIPTLATRIATAIGGRTNPPCLSAGLYCGPLFDNWPQVGFINAGYGANAGEARNNFARYTNTFTLYGATSDQSVTMTGQPSHVIDPGAANQQVSWCGPSVGLEFTYQTNGNGALLIQPASGDPPACAVGYYGWDELEDVYIVPAFPLSIVVTTPADEAVISEATLINFSAYSFDYLGEISQNIVWTSDEDGALHTGASFSDRLSPSSSPSFPPYNRVRATITDRKGQVKLRELRLWIRALTIIDVDPDNGSESGGTSVTITGDGFTTNTSVKFGGVDATGVSFGNIGTITCTTPAGTGTVDVQVVDGAFSDTLVGGYTYTGAGGITVTNVSPNNGPAAGGTSVTVTGTGFTADCVVVFEFGGPATNINFVNSTTITCDTPASSAGVEDVGVADLVTFQSGILTDGYTYT